MTFCLVVSRVGLGAMAASLQQLGITGLVSGHYFSMKLLHYRLILTLITKLWKPKSQRVIQYE